MALSSMAQPPFSRPYGQEPVAGKAQSPICPTNPAWPWADGPGVQSRAHVWLPRPVYAKKKRLSSTPLLYQTSRLGAAKAEMPMKSMRWGRRGEWGHDGHPIGRLRRRLERRLGHSGDLSGSPAVDSADLRAGSMPARTCTRRGRVRSLRQLRRLSRRSAQRPRQNAVGGHGMSRAMLRKTAARSAASESG